jgi:Na+/melibiose symporter-like transporter
LCSINTFKELLEGGENTVQFDNKATFFNNKGLFFNLLFFTLLWTAAFFDYYLLNFEIKYIPGNVHVNNVASGLSELLSLFFPLFYLEKLGIKLALLLALIAQLVGGIFILSTGHGLINALFVLMAKAGASITMNIC